MFKLRIISWVEENKDALALFKSFEPKNFGKEEYHIFNLFSPYTQSEADILLSRIRKIHYREKVDIEDYQLLRVDEKLHQKETCKENMLAMPLGRDPKLLASSNISMNKSREMSAHFSQTGSGMFRSSSRPFIDKSNCVKLPLCASSLFQQTSGGRFSNIIIIVLFS